MVRAEFPGIQTELHHDGRGQPKKAQAEAVRALLTKRPRGSVGA